MSRTRRNGAGKKAPAHRYWCVEFWDSDAWNERADTRRRHKAEAVELAQELNRRTSHDDRRCFDGHRFRVRRARDD